MSLLARINAADLAAGKLIKSQLFNDEFNQLVGANGALNGGSADKDILVKFNHATDPVLRLDQLGAGIIARLLQNGVEVARIENNGRIKTQIATAAVTLGGQYTHNVTTVGNVGGGQDDLHSFTLPANFFAADGDSLQVIFGGDFANNANPKEVGAHFGGTAFFLSSAVAFQNGGWTFEVDIIRIDSDSVRLAWRFNVNATSGNVAYGKVAQIDALNFASTIVLKATGQDSGGAPVDNSITQRMSVLRRFSA